MIEEISLSSDTTTTEESLSSGEESGSSSGSSLDLEAYLQAKKEAMEQRAALLAAEARAQAEAKAAEEEEEAKRQAAAAAAPLSGGSEEKSKTMEEGLKDEARDEGVVTDRKSSKGSVASSGSSSGSGGSSWSSSYDSSYTSTESTSETEVSVSGSGGSAASGDEVEEVASYSSEESVQRMATEVRQKTREYYATSVAMDSTNPYFAPPRHWRWWIKGKRRGVRRFRKGERKFIRMLKENKVKGKQGNLKWARVVRGGSRKREKKRKADPSSIADMYNMHREKGLLARKKSMQQRTQQLLQRFEGVKEAVAEQQQQGESTTEGPPKASAPKAGNEGDLPAILWTPKKEHTLALAKLKQSYALGAAKAVSLQQQEAMRVWMVHGQPRVGTKVTRSRAAQRGKDETRYRPLELAMPDKGFRHTGDLGSSEEGEDSLSSTEKEIQAKLQEEVALDRDEASTLFQTHLTWKGKGAGTIGASTSLSVGDSQPFIADETAISHSDVLLSAVETQGSGFLQGKSVEFASIAEEPSQVTVHRDIADFHDEEAELSDSGVRVDGGRIKRRWNGAVAMKRQPVRRGSFVEEEEEGDPTHHTLPPAPKEYFEIHAAWSANNMVCVPFIMVPQ